MSMLWRGSHKFRGLVQFQGGVQGLLADRGNGQTFYVDSRSWGSGDDDNLPGTDPNHPLATLATAYGLCTSGAGDYIVCLDGYDNDTTSITIAKTNLHIIGVNGVNPRAPFVWLSFNSGSEPPFILQGGDAANCEIAGFTLCGDASTPCITGAVGSSTQLVYGWIHHCSFAATGDVSFVAQDGILVPSDAGIDGTLIEDCTFGDEITRDGIRFTNFYDGLIRNCLFNNCGSICIDAIAGGAAAGGMPDVIGNLFHANAVSAAEGWAITSMAAGDGLIAWNNATDTYTTPTNNPYLDHNDVNQWGINYSHLTATAPATT
jgi:hypothetical protein